ncbi:hypothetical protein KO561_05075 [Radiobacillus kanasensis]|uniref:hypothetical protein n=1 Tax=Radiobacillus kanasensis TaxID=2844358 RepID=UPI001E4F38BF|nr:hypothetical protein [Radiobacillus kanasensis]UFU00326.1 hypothetical protein KO561_05075 [Radiobacillus kanasensis]
MYSGYYRQSPYGYGNYSYSTGNANDERLFFPWFPSPGGGPLGPPSSPPPVGPPGQEPQAGPPVGPPPSFVPQQTQQVGTYAVDPGGIQGCLYRFTYVWLNRFQQFWYYPTFVGRNSVAGYRWNGFRWVYFGIDLDRIESYTCV